MEKTKHKPHSVISFLIAFGAIILSLILAQITTFRNLELDLLDYRFNMRGPLATEESPIVILAIDDQSDGSTAHRWPWPREYFAHVVENLNEAGVKAIGIDVIFEQADIHGPQSDDKFAEILAQYDNVVLAGKIHVPKGRTDIVTLVPPYEKFIETGTLWGLVSFDLDEDGFYRRYLVGQTYNDTVYNSFAAEILKVYKKMDHNIRVINLEDKFLLGSTVIPKYDEYSTIINYSGPAGTFQMYSFDNVLDDVDFYSFDDPGDPELDLPAGLLYSGMLKDKIVLIGSTMQELHDEFNSPFLEVRDSEGRLSKILTPGVEIHANAINMILTENYLRNIPYWGHIAILVIFVFLVFIITRSVRTVWGALAIAVFLIIYFVAAFFVFSQWNLVVDIITPILVILFSYIGHTLYHYILSQQEKRMIKGAFSHYVPEKVVSEILENPEKLTLGGEERVVTVMFTDVVGFTSISEKLTPAELVHLLNEYLTDMTDTILQHQGIIDKYEGDAIMAEFGVPVSYENHPLMACKAALEMQRKLKNLRAKWREEGKPLLRARIGINTGEVIVGNMGSRDVFDYTVMGDHVNLGSRLEGANKFYGTAVMISEYTYEYIKNDFYTRELDLIRVKGKEKPIRVFELIALKELRLDEKFLEMLDMYTRGLTHYKAQEWDQAIDCFETCLKLRPNDPPSSEYRSRCIEYKFSSPGPDWDGVTVMREK
jgi:adenylate cyclase